MQTCKPEPTLVDKILADPSDDALGELLMNPAMSWAPFNVAEVDAKAALVPATGALHVVPASGPLTAAAYGELAESTTVTTEMAGDE
eukprot:SAG31_NODE_17245_length_678_cov_0.823834_1_plen_87_part_00